MLEQQLESRESQAFFSQISHDEYRRNPAVGSSQLKRVLRSPAHYKYDLDYPAEPTRAQDFGSLIHLAVLEPDRFREQSVVRPKFEGRGCRALQEEWTKEHQGLIVLDRDEQRAIEGMLKSLSRHRTARELLKNGRAEQSFFWRDERSGLDCKCRPDSWGEGTLVDIKSTLNASPQEFPRTIANMMYHLQGAYYLDGVSSVLGERLDRFALIAIEKVAPYAIATYVLDEATLEVGRMFYRKALKTLAQCRSKERYPAYPDRLLSTSLPSWAWPVETEEGDVGLRAG